MVPLWLARAKVLANGIALQYVYVSVVEILGLFTICYGFVCVTIVTLKMFQYGLFCLSHILCARAASDSTNQVAAFACEIFFTYISGPCYSVCNCSASVQVGTVSAFFVFAGVCLGAEHVLTQSLVGSFSVSRCTTLSSLEQVHCS